MNNIMEKILKNKNWQYVLFEMEEFYKGSFYEEDMPNYSDYSQYDTNDMNYFLRKKYIAENTEWLYRDIEGNVIGILSKFVSLLDSDGQFYYYCNSFYNIPLLKIKEIKKNGDYNYFQERYLEIYNIDLGKELELYKEFCKENNIEITDKDGSNEDEFEEYINGKINE